MEVFAEIDPLLFAKENEFDLSMALSTAAQRYIDAKEEIYDYLRVNDPELLKAMSKQFEELPMFQELSGLLGGMLVENITITPRGPGVNKEDYEKAWEDQKQSSAALIAYTAGYQNYMAEELRVAFGDDEAEVAKSSWTATWSMLRNQLQPLGGTTLAEIADFFDDLVRLEYPNTYDPVDRLRGSQATENIATRTFYETLEKHLPRAIQRSGDDNWTGH